MRRQNPPRRRRRRPLRTNNRIPRSRLIRSKGITTNVFKADPFLLTIASGASVFTDPLYFSFDASSDLSSIATARINTFAEFRYTHIRAVITALQPAVTGSSVFGFFSGSVSGLTTANIDQSPSSVIIPNSSSSTRNSNVINWVASSTSELNWNDTPTGPSAPVTTFVSYTNAASYGTLNSTGASVVAFRVDFFVTTQMRGFFYQ